MSCCPLALDSWVRVTRDAWRWMTRVGSKFFGGSCYWHRRGPQVQGEAQIWNVPNISKSGFMLFRWRLFFNRFVCFRVLQLFLALEKSIGSSIFFRGRMQNASPISASRCKLAFGACQAEMRFRLHSLSELNAPVFVWFVGSTGSMSGISGMRLGAIGDLSVWGPRGCVPLWTCLWPCLRPCLPALHLLLVAVTVTFSQCLFVSCSFLYVYISISINFSSFLYF